MQYSAVFLIFVGLCATAQGCEKRVYQCWDCGTSGCTGDSKGDVTKKCDWCMKVVLPNAVANSIFRLCANDGRKAWVATEGCGLNSFQKGCRDVSGCASGTLKMCNCKDRRCNSSTTVFASMALILTATVVSRFF